MSGVPPGADGTPASPTAHTTISFDPRSLWRAAWAVVAVVLLTQFLLFAFSDGGSVVFTVIMSWAASIALEPAVSRLSQRMRRGWATLVSMIAVMLGALVFAAIFGSMLVDQITDFVANIPELVRQLDEALSSRLDQDAVVDLLGGAPAVGEAALELAGGVLGVIVTVVGNLFSVFTFAFFTYYLSADAPRLRSWLARLLPPARQGVVVTVWELSVNKAGGYVSARLTLACISGGVTALFLFLIGMPYWLALGLWTGLVAQFVPTIGTYIAIALPVVVGLTGDNPIQGVLALAFAIVYQQIENLFLEPKISADAVEVHPAVSFASVMLGAALFGVAGAFVAVPAAALILALFEVYGRRYDLAAAIDPSTADPLPPPETSGSPVTGAKTWLERLKGARPGHV